MGKRIDPTISIMSCLERFPKDAKDVWAFSEEDETIVLSLATESPARFDFVGKALSVRLDVSCQGWRDEMVWAHILWIMFNPISFVNPTPLAHADTSSDVLPRGGTSQWCPTRFNLCDPEMRNARGFNPPTGQNRFFRPTREASKMDCTDFSAFK
ncbi:hypothetical protein TNCV_5005391 [Trichonephila clavipes]|nr:hypothetical protein TNCV_5005391 [Trichonephila clavipes]